MSLSSSYIQTIYTSRNTILELLNGQKFDVSGYANFSINEIDAMNKSDQLDMLVTRETHNTKAYIKYYLNAKQLRKENLDNLIEDLFVIENVLEKKDTLIVIVNEEPNDPILQRVKYLYEHDGIFVVLHNIARLQFNILKHALVPPITILDKKEIDELKNVYNITDMKQLPEISRFDPQALAVCLRPGDVCRLDRKSITAMKTEYYRLCV